ncbi:HAMP domain-containing protein, partial [bacterium]|nr:HAMP domain-containing protein [bacterium]
AYASILRANYPRVSLLARYRKSGYVYITNACSAYKVMAFAPIPYGTGDYRRHGIFGGVTIGFQVDQFHETARTGAALINRQLREHLRLSIIILGATSLLVVACAWLLSRGVTRPLALLTEGVRRLAGGETDSRVTVTARDEIGELADSFNRMAAELEIRKNNLLQTLEELQLSRRHILEERNFKESVLESISSAIMTLSPDGLITSINGTGKRLLGDDARIGKHYGELFHDWGDMGERVRQVLADHAGYGREPLTVERGGKTLYLEVGFFPIHGGEDAGITVTMRDETEKEELREEMTRLDRLASLGKLAAGIAHEVRNPLTGVSLLLDDLHDRAGLDPDNQALMHRALQEIERVERLIAALLNFSSPPRADFREGDLNGVISDTLLLLRRQCERQSVELSFTPGELATFRFDIEKIKQALLNLIK